MIQILKADTDKNKCNFLCKKKKESKKEKERKRTSSADM